MQRIETEADVAVALGELQMADPRLALIRKRAGTVDLRLSAPVFSTLASIVIGQQVSRASAQAMLRRLSALVHPLTASQLLSSDPTLLIQAGLSRAKQRTLLSLAAAIEREGLDLQALVARPSGEAIATLVSLPGIGPWTAEVFLLTSGHRDVFPSRDVALQAAVAQGLKLPSRPDARALAAIAEALAALAFGGRTPVLGLLSRAEGAGCASRASIDCVDKQPCKETRLRQCASQAYHRGIRM